MKFGAATGWIIEAVPSSLNNRDDLGPQYYYLRRNLIAMKFADIAMELIQQDKKSENRQYSELAFSEMSTIFMDVTTKLPDLATKVKDVNVAQLKYGFSTETSKFTYDDKPLDFRFWLTSFKGQEGKNLVDVYYAIEGRKTELIGGGDSSKVILDQSFAFYETEGDQVERLHKENVIEVGLPAEQWNRKGVLGFEAISLKPGTYDYEIHIKDKGGDRLGVYKGTFKNENYRKLTLEMSEILPVTSIRPARENDKFKKGAIAFNPRMFANFRQNEQVGIYFEVYNLALGPSNRTDYKISYKVQLFSESNVFKKMLKLFQGGKETISSEYENSGVERDEKLHLSFDLSNKPPGDYEITVTVKDLISKREVSKKVLVKLI